jgi:hypothetical protein
MGSDRRRSPRSSSAAEMHISTEDEWRRVWLVDVSAHGARFLGVHAPAAGTRMRVMLRVPCHVLRLEGVVVWNEKRRVAAVEFDPLTPYQRMSLDAALLEGDGVAAADPGAVLLMIDDTAAQAMIGSVFRACGFQLIARSTPLDAVQCVVDGSPLRAAVVSAGLPHSGGHDVLDFLADECPRVKRVLLVEPHEHAVARSSAPHHVLTKPCTERDVVPLLAGLGSRSGVAFGPNRVLFRRGKRHERSSAADQGTEE